MSLGEFGRQGCGRHSFECRFFIERGEHVVFPDFNEFLSLSQRFDVVPVYTKMLADTETPITVFRKLVGQKAGCLLESAENGQLLGRYSFIACDPFVTFSSKNGIGVLTYANGEMVRADGDPLQVLKNLLAGFRFYTVEGLARFYGGAIGYLAYEAGNSVTGSLHSPSVKDALNLPDCQMFLPETVVIYDHLTHQLVLVLNCFLQGQSPHSVYDKAVGKLAQLKEQLAAPISLAGKFVLDEEPAANMTDEEFMRKVASIIDDIHAGKAEQVVLSRRFTARFSGDDFEIYRRLRNINPSPYMFYLNQNGVKAIGSSPEMLIRVENGQVTTCPIAGTRPRGQTPQEDIELVKELLADPKELAEHKMLMEFAMEDLKKVCVRESIQVSKYLEPQYYSHVIHLASQIDGYLLPEVAPIQALAACFPAGTVTGSPRETAMKMINYYEPSNRGIYGGAVGYIGFNGVVDTGIAIRTFVVKDNQIHIQVGAGIVAGSQPDRECQEVKNKAQVMFAALGL